MKSYTGIGAKVADHPRWAVTRAGEAHGWAPSSHGVWTMRGAIVTPFDADVIVPVPTFAIRGVYRSAS